MPSYVHVAGWLRTRKRRPGHPDIDPPEEGGEGEPDQGLPPPEGETDPDYGIDLPELPTHPIVLPKPPPGVWPPPTVSHPIQPAEPDTPPGTIWPSPGTPEHPIASKKLWVVAGIPGVGWRYVCVDPSLKPGHPLPSPAPGPTPH